MQSTLILAEATMSVPVVWVLSSGAILAGSIVTLAKMVHGAQQKQIDLLKAEIGRDREQNKLKDETIKSQFEIILALQKDVSDLKSRLREQENKSK